MTARSSIVGFFNDQPIDNRVPTWDGTGGAVGLELYARLARAYIAGLEENKALLGPPRLWSNLRGEAHESVENIPAAELKAADGLDKLLNALKARWPEGPLRRLPRLYRALFKEIQYRAGDSVGPVFADFEHARKDVELGDPTVKVSEGIMGLLLLDVLQLAESEHTHILGLTGFAMTYEQVKAVVAELYPRSSHKTRHPPPNRYNPPPWRRAHVAESVGMTEASDHYCDPEDHDQSSALAARSAETDPEAEEAEGWVTESAEEAYYAEEQLAALLSTVNEEETIEIDDAKKANFAAAYAYVAEAHMSMRDAKIHMNGIAKARGFYPKGAATPSTTFTASSSSDGKNTKGATKQAVDACRKANTHCLACGRLGHWRGDAECPKRGQPSSGKSRGKGKKGKGLLPLIMTATLMFLGGASEPPPPPRFCDPDQSQH